MKRAQELREKGLSPYSGALGRYYTLEKCKASAAPFKTRIEWAKADKGAYEAALRYKWADECTGHMETLWAPRSLEEIKAIADRYPNRNQWEANDQASYKVAWRKGWLDILKPRKLFTQTHEAPVLAESEVQQKRYPYEPITRPKNGKWPVAMLVGAPADIFRETKARWERTRGVELKYHWDYEKERDFARSIPQDVDLVVMFRDFVSHAMSHRTREAVRRAQVRFIVTGSKQTAWGQIFNAMGLKRTEPLPLSRRPAPPPLPPHTPVEVLSLLKPIAPEAPEAAEAPKPAKTPPVNIVVTSQQIPAAALPPHRQGTARPETAAVIAALQAMCAEDGVSVLIDPSGFQVSAAK